jgi:hypothetical protein
MQPSKKIVAVYKYICRHPGSRKNTICRKFGIRSLDSFLIGFEVVGLYLYEDDEGRLFIAEAVNG